ncbi:putative PEP-binding protein, partial [Pseudovibrio sp. POLY-S9]
LFQFFYAVDRGNTLVAERFEALSPSFLRALRKIVVIGDKMDTPVTLCGELGGQPLAAMALLAIGYRNLSMSPASIGPVKAMLRSLDLSALSEELLKQLEAGKGTDDIREFLANFASENNIPV